MKLRIKYADQVVGAFILLSILALALALIFIGLNQRWLAKNYRFKSEFLSGSGISPGTSISFHGFSIGKIESIKLNRRNTVDVTFYIYDTYYEKVKEFSILELSVSPIGLGSSLLFHQGRGGTTLPEGSFIPRASSSEARAIIENGLVEIPPKDDTITRLLSNVNPLLENANEAVVTLNKTLTEVNYALAGEGSGPVAKILRNADEAVGSLNATMGAVRQDVPVIMAEVDGIMGRVDGIMTQVSDVMTRVDSITGDVKELTAAVADPTGLVPKLLDPKGSIKTILDDDDALFNRITGLLDDVKSTMASVDSITRRLNNEMPGISVLLTEGKATLVKAQDVLEGLKNNPILKGGIPERKDQEALFRSLRDKEF